MVHIKKFKIESHYMYHFMNCFFLLIIIFSIYQSYVSLITSTTISVNLL